MEIPEKADEHHNDVDSVKDKGDDISRKNVQIPYKNIKLNLKYFFL